MATILHTSPIGQSAEMVNGGQDEVSGFADQGYGVRFRLAWFQVEALIVLVGTGRSGFAERSFFMTTYWSESTEPLR